MRYDRLDKYHPAVAFTFFAVALTISVVFFHPAVNGLSLLAALLYGIWLKGRAAVEYFLALPVTIGVITVIVNLLFVHKGITVLAYLGDNTITREAIIYGCSAGLLTGALLMWFYCAGVIMTSDKLIYIFGHILPSASLMFSMTLRFVPDFAKQAGRISQARKGMGCNDGSKLRGSIKTISVMTTWALENSIETADSMKARGYGRPGRTAYSLFKWRSGDMIMILIIAALTAVGFAGRISFSCYPVISESGAAGSIAAIGILCFIPLILDMWEDLQWKYYQSKI